MRYICSLIEVWGWEMVYPGSKGSISSPIQCVWDWDHQGFVQPCSVGPFDPYMHAWDQDPSWTRVPWSHGVHPLTHICVHGTGALCTPVPRYPLTFLHWPPPGGSVPLPTPMQAAPPASSTPPAPLHTINSYPQFRRILPSLPQGITISPSGCEGLWDQGVHREHSQRWGCNRVLLACNIQQ